MASITVITRDAIETAGFAVRLQRLFAQYLNPACLDRRQPCVRESLVEGHDFGREIEAEAGTSRLRWSAPRVP
jgi:hypothetical protein